MKYNVVDRGDETSVQLKNRFHALAAECGLSLDPECPDIVVSIGGDGTLLQAFHLYVGRLEQTSFVGIHTGHLGFYADWKPQELDMLIRHMAADENRPSRTVKYPIINIQLVTEQGTETYLALNECTLKGVEGTLVAEVRINDEQFEMFRGDGICISTPTGSTGYNRSLNGAILHPALEAVQIAEMASLNNRVYRSLGSSIVLPKHHHCDIYPRRGHKLLFTLDHLNEQLTDLVSIRCMVADQKVSFVRYRPFPFWNRVRESFIGDIVE